MLSKQRQVSVRVCAILASKLCSERPTKRTTRLLLPWQILRVLACAMLVRSVSNRRATSSTRTDCNCAASLSLEAAFDAASASVLIASASRRSSSLSSDRVRTSSKARSSSPESAFRRLRSSFGVKRKGKERRLFSWCGCHARASGGT